MLIEETLLGTIDKVQTAIDRLKAFEPKDRPYWLQRRKDRGLSCDKWESGDDLFNWWITLDNKKDDPAQISIEDYEEVDP